MIRRIPRLNTSVRIAFVMCAVASLSLVGAELNAQAALTVPAGLPDWAFNIPDKIQPSRRAAGRHRSARPAARRSTTPPGLPGTRIRRTGFPTNIPLRRDR